MKKPKIGVALGSGSARGWSHIGVLQELEKHNIYPEIITGCSAGSVVGGFYAQNKLKELEDWAKRLTRIEVASFLDINLMGGSGFIKGNKMIEFFRSQNIDAPIESLPVHFGAVATDLHTGREVWFKKGSLLAAMRASVSLPGFLVPFKHEDRWLIDGGLVNPVPTNLCRALGADIVIAVNLNNDLISPPEPSLPQEGGPIRMKKSLMNSLGKYLPDEVMGVMGEIFDSNGVSKSSKGPGYFEVVSSMMNIMIDQITRNRAAGDPADITLCPRLSSHLAWSDFHRAEIAIEEGKACVQRMIPAIEDLMRRLKA